MTDLIEDISTILTGTQPDTGCCIEQFKQDRNLVCQLPNGSTLKFCYKGFRGNQNQYKFTKRTPLLKAFGSKELKEALEKGKKLSVSSRRSNNPKIEYCIRANQNRCRKLAANIKKKEHPLLGLWNSDTDQHLIAADFDRKDFEQKKDKGRFSSFYELYQYAQQNLRGCRIAISPSGGVKVFYVVSAPIMNHTTALNFLEDTLPADLYEHIDKSLGAVSLAYLNEGILQALESTRFLPVREIKSSRIDWKDEFSELEIDSSYRYDLPPALSTSSNTSNSNSPSSIYLYTPSEGVSKSEHKFLKIDERPEKYLPEFRFWINNSEIKAELLKVLIKCTGLLSAEGFDLPQKKLAKELNTSQKTISKHLEYLRNKGLLKITDYASQPGVKAQTYVAIGALREAIQVANKKAYTLKKQPPTQIQDGNWNKDLWKIQHSCFYLHQYEEFRDYALSLPGATFKDRPKKIEVITNKMKNRYQTWLERKESEKEAA